MAIPGKPPSASDFWKSEKVVILDPKYDTGKVYTVSKVNRVTVKVVDPSNDAEYVVSPSSLRRYNTGDPLPKAPSYIFHPGETVRWEKKRYKIFVVCRQSRETVTIALFGGEGGKTYRAEPTELTKVIGKAK